MKTYKDIYKLPLRCDECINWVYDDGENFVFQFESQFIDEEYDPAFIKLRDKIMRVLNSDEKMEGQDKFYHQDGLICKQGTQEPIITIRGWGNLTGVGGHNLPPEEAANIQDTFAEFIVEKLNAE